MRIILALVAGAHLMPAQADWPAYHGSPAQTHSSTLDQINTRNVAKLREVWRYDTGDAFPDSEMQCNPLVIGGNLYATSPKLRVFALDAATGRELWSFDPFQGQEVRGKQRSRGLVHWNGRIYVGARQWLWALDAKTGQPVKSFGNGGRIDLREGLGRPAEGLNVAVSTPGVVFRDLLILGSIVPEGAPSAPGFIRAFHLRTGKLVWTFRTIPAPGDFGYATWPPETWKHAGGANAWAGLTLDEKRGLVFAPTGSATYDFYGSDRHGDNLFANSLIALDARTGKRRWHFQFVRHDVWDRDLPAPPSLVTVIRDGRPRDAVAQITKSGHVWVFDRDTGESLFPWHEVTVPPSPVDGEKLAHKQPLPLAPEPFGRQKLTEELLTRRTPEAHAAVLAQFRRYRNGDQFEPPSHEGTILFPGFDGGGEWGGAAWDQETGLLYVNSNEMAWVIKLIERRKPSKNTTAANLYKSECAACHKANLKGSPPEFPALDNLAGRRTRDEIVKVTREGAGRMPGFVHLTEEAATSLADYLLDGQDRKITLPLDEVPPYWVKYSLDGYARFNDPDGYPAIAPPWGTLNAINLNTGEYAWRIPLGEWPELAEKGMKNTGSENYGGAVVTKGGLLFIAATNVDRKIRAFEKKTGALLWEAELPAAGNATPATYMVNGRQYVVIAAGGGKWGNRSGGAYVAFALEDGP
ncbi:MAG: PQQ-binding-like beta-propeller repeat protein [Bryobacteraceae bacterium]|nr:PQQ-binding-like beta-propeller repeat protein [Bryobacteraceae bacterium]